MCYVLCAVCGCVRVYVVSGTHSWPKKYLEVRNACVLCVLCDVVVTLRRTAFETVTSDRQLKLKPSSPLRLNFGPLMVVTVFTHFFFSTFLPNISILHLIFIQLRTCISLFRRKLSQFSFQVLTPFTYFLKESVMGSPMSPYSYSPPSSGGWTPGGDYSPPETPPHIRQERERKATFIRLVLLETEAFPADDKFFNVLKVKLGSLSLKKRYAIAEALNNRLDNEELGELAVRQRVRDAIKKDALNPKSALYKALNMQRGWIPVTWFGSMYGLVGFNYTHTLQRVHAILAND